ncbi:MAG: cysteine desulfurase [Candidatus Omnitrophica bacterium]|nr:cysteine desulfurase [Candidatus Omnitrophota bacterium]
MTQRINLDYASTTPLLPEVKAAIAAALEEMGNPSSIHEAGRRARQALERACAQVAALISAKPEEVFFTSCGTEANNWALRGLMSANKRKGQHLIISAIEHPSISLAARRLELEGARVSMLSVDREGMVPPSALSAALTPETVLVSIMLANGEVGTIEPIRELAAIAHEQGALFHTDTVAAVGYIPVDVKALGVDALSLAASQFYGPQGAAALFAREGVRILPLLEGGGQERGGRSGTEALPAIVGMGVAAELAKQRLSFWAGGERSVSGTSDFRAGTVPPMLRFAKQSDGGERENQPSERPHAGRPERCREPNASQDPPQLHRLAVLRDRLRDGLQARIEHLRLNGSWSSRLPHNLHICIDGVSSESLVLGLDQAGIAAGLGSACNSKAMRPSHVLKAMGLSEDEAKGALVLSVGIPTTDEEIDRALEIIPRVVQRLRNVTALTSRVP